MEFETADNRPPDGDGDGVDDLAEATLGSDPARWDTDDDGFSDGQEREEGSDRVLVPDFCVATARHPQLWVQRFIPSRGRTMPTENRGNHGFAVGSAVAADFDDRLPTGSSPTASERPTDYLEVLSLPLGGLLDVAGG